MIEVFYKIMKANKTLKNNKDSYTLYILIKMRFVPHRSGSTRSEYSSNLAKYVLIIRRCIIQQEKGIFGIIMDMIHFLSTAQAFSNVVLFYFDEMLALAVQKSFV